MFNQAVFLDNQCLLIFCKEGNRLMSSEKFPLEMNSFFRLVLRSRPVFSHIFVEL